MAFPTTRSSVLVVQATNSTSWTLNYDDLVIQDGGGSTIEADDLIVINIGRDGTTLGSPAITGYTLLFDQTSGGGGCRGLTFAKIATGSESGTFSYTTENEQGVARIIVIKDWHGTISGGVEVSTAATGSDDSPNPPSFSPSWGAADTYWRAVYAIDTGNTGTTAYPTDYTILQNSDQSGGGAGAGLGSAGRNLNAATENPGTFTAAASRPWVAWVVAVRPAAAGFTGTVSVTLAAATSSASGTVTEPAITGTATPTMGAATGSASGSVVEAITGTVGVTLAAATSTASGTHTPPGFTGTATPTMAAATSTASGTVTEPAITGTATPTLAAATSTAIGTTVPYTVHDLDGSSNQTVYTTASVNPTADSLQILIVQAVDDNTIIDPTVDGSAQGITWDLVATNNDLRRLWMYRGVPSSPTTGSTTITFSEQIDSALWSHTEWTDRLNTNNGADAIVQINQHNQVGLATTSHLAMQEWVDPTNGIGLAAFAVGNTSTVTDGTGWTEVGDVASGVATLHVQYAEGEQFKPRVNWTGNAHHFAIAIELLPLASPPTPPDSITKPILLDETGGTGTSGSSSSYAPTDGALLLAAFDYRRNAGSPVSPNSVTGNNVTWTEIGAVDYNTGASPVRRMSVWAAKSDGTTDALDFTFSLSATAWRVSIWEVGGVTATSLTTDDIVQFDTNALDSVTAINATLGAFGATPNGTLAFSAVAAATEYIETEDGIALANADTPDTFYLMWQFSNNTTPGVAVMPSGNAAILAVEVDPAAVGAITGTATVTLGAATSTASGTHTPPGFSGTVGATLSAATSTASGTVTEPAISGTATPTLGAATSSASGTVTEPAITGTVGVTLAAATSIASGTHTPPGFSGTSAVTLGAAIATASGTVTEPPITGTVGVTLGAATATASGTVGVDAVTGNINVTLAAATASASGTVTEPAISGTVAVTLGAATGSANGLNVLDITGTITVTLAAATATAAGTTVAPYWWEYAPVGATTSTPAHTKTPVSYTKIHGDDQSPW